MEGYWALSKQMTRLRVKAAKAFSNNYQALIQERSTVVSAFSIQSSSNLPVTEDKKRNQYISQSINQSINQSVDASLLCCHKIMENYNFLPVQVTREGKTKHKALESEEFTKEKK